MRYTIIIEKAGNNYCAHAPDLPGCIATGATVQETKRVMQEAVELHLRGFGTREKLTPSAFQELTQAVG